MAFEIMQLGALNDGGMGPAARGGTQWYGLKGVKLVDIAVLCGSREL